MWQFYIRLGSNVDPREKKSKNKPINAQIYNTATPNIGLFIINCILAK